MPFKFNPLSGQLDLVNSAVSPGGSSGNVQYNNGSGGFAGTSGFTWDNALKILTISDGTNKTWTRGNGSYEAYSDSANASFFGLTNGLEMLVGINYLGSSDMGLYNRSDGSHLVNLKGTNYSFANGVIQYDTSIAYLSVQDTLRFDLITSPVLIASDIASATDFQLGYSNVAGTGTVAFVNTAIVKKFSFNGQITISSGGISLGNANDIAVGTGTGTKIGTATTQKIGFWNKTPIVQPTTATVAGAFVVGAGTAVNTASTFDGYTIGKVVTALRNVGILA